MSMGHKDDLPRHGPSDLGSTPTAQELKGDIDSGRTGDKVASYDPGAAPLGTDDEAAGTPDTPDRVALAMRQELGAGRASGPAAAEDGRRAATSPRPRPKSPNIQIYRPQLTSVLSILNRITGTILSACGVVLVIWLMAAAAGPGAYGVVQEAITSWAGQIVLLAATFAFFLHLCGGIRHLVWDTVHGFELRTIYISGWAVVGASIVLTLAAWLLSVSLKG
jgi:succinate dehydrogenase / fumarate reductase cytochrome b subunit